jgi:RNA polymerase sigma-70 factor (ECF subfamily)
MVDRDLVERAQHGDRASYDTLARAVAPRLYRIAYRILRDADQAQDAMQVSLIGIWRDLPSLRDPARFEAWTYKLVVRAAGAELRRSGRQTATIRVLRLDDADGDDQPAARDDLREIHERDELAGAFGRLTPDQRAVIVLRHYVGLPIDEIAKVLDIPNGTAASRLHYATQALRAALEAVDRLASHEVNTA